MTRHAPSTRGAAYRALCAEADRFGWTVELFAQGSKDRARLTSLGVSFSATDAAVPMLNESLLLDDDLDRAAERISSQIREGRSA